MDFTLNAEQTALQETVRRFADGELRDAAKQIEEADQAPGPEIMKQFADMGLLGVNIDENLGGVGGSHLDAVLVLEEVAKLSPALAFPIFESCFGPVLAIAHFAPEAMRERIVPKVCAGEMMVAVAMSEPNAGTALTDLTTKAEVRGDKIIVNGQKRWCSGAGHSDAYVVYSRMSDDPGAKGIGAVLVEKGTEGFSFGKREQHMGFRGIHSADMFFDNVEVPMENMVVPAGGFRKLMEAFDLERCGNTTMSLAIAQSAFDYVLEYVQERQQFGKPIVDFQAVQLHLAEMKMKLDASRLLLYRAVVNAESDLPSVGESSIAKCFANEIVRDVTGKCMQLMGGYGYSREYPIEQKMRDGWAWGIAGGAIDIQKVNIAAALVGRRFSQRV
ncbi:MAG: acyl-CoA dehydrogenase [Rhodospirillaceae bacterium]|nr:acyl-CoA dehydrogenase [Rhodospirillaceae bacterium]MBT3908734.1 acyl-CoA dehydrogenase [Rhodospirillaceae bacterium]MBT5297805.1 acyl-CoA dehydrogenase [Rhodospirillaceae bacterium]MBT5514984.1 acyl-CoA dehydrogenase [Rhodospirillaceae bacterium]MBT6085723.1 acyl-CoA dehydrogenase [Rhodospirillaceae bacterium]